MTEISKHGPENLEKLRKQIEEAKKNGQTTISVSGIDSAFLEDLRKYSNMLAEEGKKEDSPSKEELGKSGNTLADRLDEPVRNNETHGQRMARRAATAGKWFVETTIEKPFEILGKKIEDGKIEDFPIELALAMGEQLLKVLDGINNWIKERDFSKKAEKTEEKKEGEKGQNKEIKNPQEQTKQMPQALNRKLRNKQTNNIPKPSSLEMYRRIRGRVH